MTSSIIQEITRRTVSWMMRAPGEVGPGLQHLAQRLAGKRQIGEVDDLEQPGAQAIVDVVGVVGDVVGDGGDLGLGARHSR